MASIGIEKVEGGLVTALRKNNKVIDLSNPLPEKVVRDALTVIEREGIVGIAAVAELLRATGADIPAPDVAKPKQRRAARVVKPKKARTGPTNEDTTKLYRSQPRPNEGESQADFEKRRLSLLRLTLTNRLRDGVGAGGKKYNSKQLEYDLKKAAEFGVTVPNKYLKHTTKKAAEKRRPPPRTRKEAISRLRGKESVLSRLMNDPVIAERAKEVLRVKKSKGENTVATEVQ